MLSARRREATPAMGRGTSPASRLGALFPGLQQPLAQLALVLGRRVELRRVRAAASRPERPKSRSNSSVVLKIAAPKRERPDSSIRPRSARVCDRRLRGDAADPGDLGPRDRLQVGDDRQRLRLGLGQRRRPRLRQQAARRLLAGRVAGQGEAAGDLAQDDAAPALGEVLAQQLDRLLDLALGRLGRLRQVGGGDRLRREEEQRLDRAARGRSSASPPCAPRSGRRCPAGPGRLAAAVELEQGEQRSPPG